MQERRFATLAFVAIVGSSAAVHGVVTNRWSGGDAAPAIPAIPLSAGDWAAEEMTSNVTDPALANVTRRYTHARSGRSFVVSLTCGRAGLTSQHTPEYCYTGSGYEGSGTERRQVPLAGGPGGEFFTTVFRKQSREGEEALRIFWGWSADGTWVAPTLDPRLAFIGKPNLYKLYVVAAGAHEAEPGRDPILDEFLGTLLGSLNAALFAAR